MMIIDAEFTEIKTFDEKMEDFLNQPHFNNPVPLKKVKVRKKKVVKKYNFRSLENWKKFWIEIRPFVFFLLALFLSSNAN